MFEEFYENIGGKIKNWAKWTFIFEIIASIVVGIYFLIEWGFEDAWWALFIIFLGPIVALASTWILYAFGELVEDVHDLRYSSAMKNIDKNVQLLATPLIHKEREKAEREAEERAQREVEERAKQEAQKQVKRQTASVKKGDTLPEMLEYALQFQTDEGMICCLKEINDSSVQGILNSPSHLIRKQIQELLEQSSASTEIPTVVEEDEINQ